MKEKKLSIKYYKAKVYRNTQSSEQHGVGAA